MAPVASFQLVMGTSNVRPACGAERGTSDQKRPLSTPLRILNPLGRRRSDSRLSPCGFGADTPQPSVLDFARPCATAFPRLQ